MMTETYCTDLGMIHTDCGEAIQDAKGLAAYHEVPYVVWRCGDRFTAMREGTRVEKAWSNADQPIRPVAVYDPDGGDTILDYPPLGSKVRCLAAPRWAPPGYEAMVGQIGTVFHHHPPDPEEEQEGAIGIQYPLTPYSDNRIAQDLSLEGVTWQRIT